jgi:hypothetical protein
MIAKEMGVKSPVSVVSKKDGSKSPVSEGWDGREGGSSIYYLNLKKI